MSEGKRFCEFFAGIGLVRAGLAASGWECVYANDNAEKKRAMYTARYLNDRTYHLADVADTAAVVARIPGRPFLATASFPCVDLSLAGHYRGFAGEQSSAFFGFTQALDALADRRPPLVLLENVPGFLTARGGADFRAAAAELARLGYWLDAFVLDAAAFVPQSRPRVFVVGLAESLRPGRFAPPGGRSLFPAAEPDTVRPPAASRFKNELVLPTGWVHLPLPTPPANPVPLDRFIDTDDEQAWWPADQAARHYEMMSDRHRERVDAVVAAGTRWVGTMFRRVRHGATRAEVRFDGLAGCLRTPRGGSARQIVIAIDAGRLRMRWMSPREYARLQGAADFPITVGPTDAMWGFADAVCVPAVAWIDRHVLTPLYDAAVARERAA